MADVKSGISGAEISGPIGLNLPDEQVINNQFKYLVKYWRGRNRFVNDVRNALSGNNKISAPESLQYAVKVLHTYTLAAMMNEKMSRYMPRPSIQVIPDDDLDDDGRQKSTRIELGLNVGGYEIERRGGGDVWDRVVADAIILDMGVQRILCSPADFWEEIVKHDKAIENGDKPVRELVLGTDQREGYKKEQGVPITKDYVPLEYFFPHYEKAKLKFSFEIEERSLMAVHDNPFFKNEAGQKVLDGMPISLRDGGLEQSVTIVHFVNDKYHAYYIAGPGKNSRSFPRVTPESQVFTGNLQFLYGYEHGLGRSVYNTVAGRFGGWKTSTNRIEGVGKGILELAQAADEVVSQVFTNTRAKYWPSLNFQMDPEKRGFGDDGTKAQAPKIKEGEPIVTFTGESIQPIFKAEDDPMVMWLWERIQEQLSKLGGSMVLYGGRAPGVDTGYNQALQQTQAESLDNKQEQHIQSGAEEEALITMLHVKKIGEPVWMHYAEIDPSTGRGSGKYITLNPKDLTPMPRLAAQVRKQRPVDFIAALKAAKEASDDRQGKGPLLSEDTIATELLSIQYPDIEFQKKIIESQKREIINSGVLSSKIGERLNIKLAKNGTPQVSPEMLQQTDPALLAAMQQVQGEAAPGAGGIDPSLLASAAETRGAGLQPGPAAGNPEPFNRLGEAVAGAMATGAGPSV